jgi:hypothetical protein
MLTNTQHIICELQAYAPCALNELQAHLASQDVKINLTELEAEVDELIDSDLVEYYDLVDDGSLELGYELSSNWYALTEAEQEQMLTPA